MNTVNPVQFFLRNPGLNLDPGSTNSSRIAPQGRIDTLGTPNKRDQQCFTDSNYHASRAFLKSTRIAIRGVLSNEPNRLNKRKTPFVKTVLLYICYKFWKEKSP
jgi:hypothetical protein